MDSSWDVDHTRVVPRRAIAYSKEADGFHTYMPFEDVHGNRGLLTTVGDLLKWNENFVSPRVGDLAFVRELEQPGRLNDGRAHGYALGLVVGERNGVREISHNGGTAGYRAELTRYPDQHVSVAVLCNVSTATPSDDSRAVAALYLPLQADGSDLRPTSPSGSVERFVRSSPGRPVVEELRHYVGTYVSDEAESTFHVIVERGSLVLTRRPDSVMRLMPLDADTFSTPALGTVIFRRDSSGNIDALSVVQDRVWDLRFTRQPLQP
jgi:hypothetical protein